MALEPLSCYRISSDEAEQFCREIKVPQGKVELCKNHVGKVMARSTEGTEPPSMFILGKEGQILMEVCRGGSKKTCDSKSKEGERDKRFPLGLTSFSKGWDLVKDDRIVESLGTKLFYGVFRLTLTVALGETGIRIFNRLTNSSTCNQ